MAGRGRCGALLGAVAVASAVVLAPAVPAYAEPVRALQWHLKTLRVAEAHKITTGRGVVVAVLDSGVQADHPDLTGQVLDGTRITDDDGSKGKVDRKNHGTGVAGLIAAKGGGPSHALGIAPGAKILPVKVAFTAGGTDLPQAIRWAVDHGANVINISAATNLPEGRGVDAVQYALDHDVVVVAGAGNLEGDDRLAKISYPATVPGVLVVSAVDRKGVFWSGGVQGPEIGISAPGVEIETLANRPPIGDQGGYLKVPGGTSASAPMVAGAAALVRAKYPKMRANDVIARLIKTADDAGPKGRDPQYGFGRLNIVRALTADVPTVAANPLGYPSVSPKPVDGPLDGSAHDEAWDKTARQLAIAGGVVLGAVVLMGIAAVVIVMLVRRRRRRTNPAGPAQQQYPQPGPYPQSQQQYPQPGPYPQSQQYQPPQPPQPYQGYPTYRSDQSQPPPAG